MTNAARRILLAVAATTLAATALAAAPANSIEIVIVGGPHAGTYRPPTETIICMDVKAGQFAASYKDFAAHDPKAVGEAGLTISNPTESGTKRGDVLVTFGDPGKKPVSQYALSIPGDGVLTFARTGASAELTFKGRAKDGATLTMTARCADIESF